MIRIFIGFDERDGAPREHAASVHYTLGGAYFREFSDCQHGAWQNIRDAMPRVHQRGPGGG